MNSRICMGPIRNARQQGAALVVSLVLLLVLTILGVSTMGTAKMEMRMAANAQFFENAFQLADTGLDTNLAGLNAETIAAPPVTTDNTCAAPAAAVIVADLGGTYQNTMCFMREAMSMPPGAGSSASAISTFFYQTNAQGIAEAQASSFHSLGLSKLGPKP